MRRVNRLGSAPRLLVALVAAVSLTAFLTGCTKHSSVDRPLNPSDDTPEARGQDAAARKLISEMLELGGSSSTARDLARRLRTNTGQTDDPHPYTKASYWVHFAIALDSDWHGRLNEAPEQYMRALAALRVNSHPNKRLLAHFAALQAVGLRHNAQDLWKRWSPWVRQALRKPQGIGWRARTLLAHWLHAKTKPKDPEAAKQRLAAELGCVTELAVAGPFGPGSRAALFIKHPAETTQPWPHTWPVDSTSGIAPEQLETEIDGCDVSPKEPQPAGVYYSRTVLRLDRRQQLVLSAGNIITLWVNGKVVLSRDPRTWGSWINRGAVVELPKGNHLVTTKSTSANAALYISTPDGLPKKISASKTSLAAAAPVHTTEIVDTDVLAQYVKTGRVHPPSDPLVRYAAARLAAVAGEPEAASLLMDPDSSNPQQATGPALLSAARFARKDPAFAGSVNEDRVRELYARALERDPYLWEAELDGISRKMKTQGIEAAVPLLRTAAEKYTGVPNLLSSLASAYGELGWQPEHAATVKLRARRFPESIDAQHAAAQVFVQEGDLEGYNRAVARIRTLDPESDVLADIAIQQQDYPQALAELERLQQQRPKDKGLQQRIKQLERRITGKADPQATLEEAIEQQPKNPALRTLLADLLSSRGDDQAHNLAIVDAARTGANTRPLNQAADLLSGTEELAAYRLDGLAVIREYEAENRPMPGTAARVLDYLALWVRADGSSRMLEHEIIKIQSEEAISKFAEARVTGDRVLQMRVIKRDGRLLEPILVSGKPTVTFPHLEVGDYIETEQLMGKGGALSGTQYDSPTWFFREQDVSYARSEFVFISPKGRTLDIETTGDVPAPSVESKDGVEVRRWRVNRSPAAPNEPNAAPLTEYFPSVHVSWGHNLQQHLDALAHGVERNTPIDPRVVKLAKTIAQSEDPTLGELQRARLLYRWVLDNVRRGKETDGRRAIFSKKGNRWRAFVALCDALGIQTQWAFARSRIAPTPTGPADQARQFSSPVLIVGKKPVVLTFSGKYFPFAYVPSVLRGQHGYAVSLSGHKRIRIPAGGTQDALGFKGLLSVARNGSAAGEVISEYEGRLAASVREALEDMGERRLKSSLESQVLGRVLRGSKLLDYDLVGQDQLDAPFAIRMKAEVPQWIQSFENQLRIVPPFTPTLSEFATLPARKTPILLRQAQIWRVHLKLKLPADSRVTLPPNESLNFQSFRVVVKDKAEGNQLTLEREVHIPAGRISVERYDEFVRFTRAADRLLAREIPVAL